MKKHKLAVFMATALTFLTLTGNAAAYTWYSYGGHEYTATTSWESWTQAQTEAKNLGGYLVSINDAAEQTWVYNLIWTIEGPSFPITWIGLHRVGETWVWDSGEPVTYTNWGSGYPSPPPADYAWLHPWASGTWGNYAADLTYPAIMERPVPLPSTLLLLGSGLAGLAAWRRRRG